MTTIPEIGCWLLLVLLVFVSWFYEISFSLRDEWLWQFYRHADLTIIDIGPLRLSRRAPPA